MDFRVELSDQAQSDVAAVFDWLQSQQAGDAGERWFVALQAAIGSFAIEGETVQVLHIRHGRRRPVRSSQ